VYKEHKDSGGGASAAEGKATMTNRFLVRKVAVLGAGVMGAQIAAHLVNVKVPVVLFDLPAKEGPKNGIVTKAVEGLKKLKPSPLGVPDDAALIQAANYEEHLGLLAECDLVIEAIAERMDWKLDLYRKIAPHVASHAILASNTSGLSITKLSEALPEALKPRFCGIHFFNPPRYMVLVELIAHADHRTGIRDDLETFVTSGLARAWCARKGRRRTSSPTASASPACSARCARWRSSGSPSTWWTTSRARSSGALPAAPSARRTWWGWTRWRTSSRPCRTRCRPRPIPSTAASARRRC